MFEGLSEAQKLNLISDPEARLQLIERNLEKGNEIEKMIEQMEKAFPEDGRQDELREKLQEQRQMAIRAKEELRLHLLIKTINETKF